MHDLYTAIIDAIIHLVRIAKDDQFANAGLVCLWCNQRKAGKLTYPPLNLEDDGIRQARRDCAVVRRNRLQIIKGLRSKSDPHRGRGKNAAISSSRTNSPRSACSIPRRIAARVSSSNGIG